MARLDRYRIGIPRELSEIRTQPWLSKGSLTLCFLEKSLFSSYEMESNKADHFVSIYLPFLCKKNMSLKEIKRSGYGCYINNTFVGASCYANNATLL